MLSESLWQLINAAGAPAGRLHGSQHVIPLAALEHATSLGGRLEELRERSVVLQVKDQLTGALALIELDGVARRVVLCPPDLAPGHLPSVVHDAGADAWVGDGTASAQGAPDFAVRVAARPELARAAGERRRSCATEWVLLTSGTTGVPKLVLHTLGSLTSAFPTAVRPASEAIVWSTFYDIRRYGGLQVFLRSLYAGSLVLSDSAESLPQFLARAAAAGVTHISGTPSHWRRVLMSGTATTITPRYVRLSGEIADQPVLDSLRASYPGATVAHAFASTEAGVAFEVRDGRAGFPAALVGAPGPVELRVTETLQIRSAGTALRYLGKGAEPLRAADGYVDTGDRVEEAAGRYYFMGRRGGVINVGGLKVHPEEVEAVINAHPWVRMSLVRARRNAITGALVTAEVVIATAGAGRGAPPAADVLTRELTEHCRRSLAPHKVPALIRIVPALEVSASGKLVRPIA